MKWSIDEVCRAAKECGMSYGMYVVAIERMTEDDARRAMDEGKRLNPAQSFGKKTRLDKPCARCGKILHDALPRRKYCDECRKALACERTKQNKQKKKAQAQAENQSPGKIRLDKPCARCGTMLHDVLNKRLDCDNCRKELNRMRSHKKRARDTDEERRALIRKMKRAAADVAGKVRAI